MVLNKRALIKPLCTPSSTTKRRDVPAQSTKMKVYIRIRPLNERELEMGNRSIVKLVDDRMLVFDPKENDQPFFFHGVKQRMRDITKKQNKEMQFVFDRVFDARSANEDVYGGSICEILPSLLEGYNCSVFVYGATGAGKTHTMLGNDTSPGIIYLTMRSLYSEIEQMKEEKHFDIGISYLEVYNENVHDLLNPSSGSLHLREDSVNGVIVAGMKLVQIVDASHLFELLRQGNANRTQHPTDANAESSRSHAVFQVFIKMQARDSEQVQIVKLSMIDLAGSERGAATNCKGMRFKEGSNINKSLLALGNCINNLADGVKHIPYRDSKLTRLLKDSLGGNCQTVMIACVGPTVLSYEDTYNTLKYAARARTIKTKIAKTIMSVDTHIDHYKILVQEQQNKIAALEAEIQQLREAALHPTVGDVSAWTEKITSLYTTKKSLHQEILTLESKEKIVRWRIKYKHNNADRISAFDNSDDEEFNRIETSANRMEGAVTGLYTKMTELWDRKIEIDGKLSTLRDEIEKQKLSEALAAEIIKQESQIAEVESRIQVNHLCKLLNLIDVTNEIQKNIISKMADQYNQHHTLLRGYDKITSSMDGERKYIKTMLKGNYNISWEISPNNEMKKRDDMLKRFAVLSVEVLRTGVKPCPLIIKEEVESEEEEEEEEMKVDSEDEKVEMETNDATFSIPVSMAASVSVPEPVASTVAEPKAKFNTFAKPVKSPHRRLNRVTPLRPNIKKMSMKENVKPFQNTIKRTPLPSYHQNRNKPGALPTIKTPKAPLVAKNKNVTQSVL